MGEAGNRLICHRVENGEGNITLCSALVEQGLYITFCKDATAACNAIALGSFFCQGVDRRGLYIEQACHLVDERAGAPGAGAVHPHLKVRAQEEDFGIFAAEFDDYIG